MGELTTQTFGPVEAVSGVPSLEFDDIFSKGQRLLHPKDRLEVAEEFVPLLEGQTDAVELEYRTHPDNGPVRWVQMKAFIDETGSTMLIGMSTDITDQKEYEARLESFASIISHDLRNPLSVAKGRLELAQRECDTEHLDHVARAHDRMETLVDDLLSLTRGGQDIGEMERIGLNTLPEECWATVQTGAAGLHVETEG